MSIVFAICRDYVNLAYMNNTKTKESEMKEYYSIYSTTHGFKFFKTQKEALNHMRTANDYFQGGVSFHKEDSNGLSLLSVD